MSFAPFLAILITVATGWFIIKRYPTHMILLLSGLVLITVAIICGQTAILPKNVRSTGFIWFDMIDLLRTISIRQVSNIGMIIMVASGFAKYMEAIGASGALVHLSIKPLKALRQPYLVLALCYLLGQSMSPVIPTAGGKAMLLLTTVYPILLGLGVSPAAGAAAIACSTCIGMGPGTGTVLFAAKIANIEPIVYFVHYQIPIVIPMMLTIAVTNYFVQQYFDRKNDDIYESATMGNVKDLPVGPAGYALLPVLPILFLCVFSQLGYSAIRIDTVTSLFLSWLIGVAVELIRLRNFRKVLMDAMTMIKSMGAVFSTIVALIIAAEMFATGLRLTGLIDLALKGAHAGGLGVTAMAVFLSGIIGIVTFLTGSGVGALTSFGSLAADVANSLGGSVTQLISSMQFSAGLIRGMSPVAGSVIIVAGAVGASPFAIIRRTCIPLGMGWLAMMIGNYIMLA